MKKIKTGHIMIRLPEELKAQLEAYAAAKGIGASTVIRMIVMENANKYFEGKAS